MLLLLPGCVVLKHPCDDCRVDDCEEIALREEDGSLDECDYAACEMCVDACGNRCAVLESFPPQYSCGEDGGWSVFDFCEDWDPTPVAID